MKNNKLSGSIIGGILGFVFVITCTSPLVSEENESNDTNTTQDNIYCNDTTIVNVVNNITESTQPKYQIAITSVYYPNLADEYVYEVIIDTETGNVVSRNRRLWNFYNDDTN